LHLLGQRKNFEHSKQRETKENQNSKQAQGLSINEEGNGSFLSSYTGSNSLKINQIYYSNQYLFE